MNFKANNLYIHLPSLCWFLRLQKLTPFGRNRNKASVDIRETTGRCETL